jgi:hypothetical protein
MFGLAGVIVGIVIAIVGFSQVEEFRTGESVARAAGRYADALGAASFRTRSVTAGALGVILAVLGFVSMFKWFITT